MRIDRFSLLILPSLLLFFACNKAAAPGGSPGKAYYEALNCKACHRIGEDGGLGGPDLTFIGFRHSPQWLDQWLKNPQGWRPGTIMPNPNLSDKARAALVDYLSGLKGEALGAQRPWDSPDLKDKPVERGLTIYSRAGCIGCHGKDGAGGYPNNNVKGNAIPALSNASQTFTKEELARKIMNGVKPEKADPGGPEPLVAMPPWGQVLKDDEIASLVEYLFSLKPGKPSSTDF